VEGLGGTATAGDPAVGLLGAALQDGVDTAAHEDWDAGLLDRLGLHVDLIQVVITAVECDVPLAPELAHHGQVFPQPADPLCDGYAL
jgi:hypothetical protein